MAEAAKPAKQETEVREDPHAQTGDDLRPLHLPLARRVQIPILAGAVYALGCVIGPTLRQEVLGWQHIERVHAAGRRCIYSFWHRTIFLAMWKWRHQGVVAMTSANFDGQLLGRALEQFGYGTTHGSSSRGGLRGLAVLARRLRQGNDAAFAADGPRGPRYVAKAGPVLLARRTGCPIVGFHLFAERAHTFEKSWDQFQLPHLFSRVVIVVGAPIEVARKADRDTLDRKHAELQKLLERVRDTAESWFKLSQVEQDRERAFWNQ